MGLALAEAGRFAEAAERFRQATVCDPTQAVFWANLGMMLKVEGQFDASLDAYDAALARAPDNRTDQGEPGRGLSGAPVGSPRPGLMRMRSCHSRAAACFPSSACCHRSRFSPT